jgi:glycosyltransferase involved in cell wall biosynthesis
MKIWHVGALPSHEKVNGLNYTIWSVAQQQARLGHQVSLVLEKRPKPPTASFAEKAGIKLLEIPVKQWNYDKNLLDRLLKSDTPQIVHLHSNFVPEQASLATRLTRQKIPYIVTPNAMSPQALRRGWLKKMLYSLLIEKRRFSKAAAVTAVTPAEGKAIQNYIPKYRGMIPYIPNPVNFEDFSNVKWKENIDAKQLVYLGRFDVLHKGIDILVEIARWLPLSIEVHLYGTPDARTSGWMKRIQSNLPPNVYFHAPVFGAEKAKILAEASMYIQTSRWEVFGVSIAEAMYLGLPCAIAETLNIAELLQEHDLGLVLSTNVEEAAKVIVQALAQPDRLRDWSKKAQAFAKDHFQAQTVALQYLTLYEKIANQNVDNFER